MINKIKYLRLWGTVPLHAWSSKIKIICNKNMFYLIPDPLIVVLFARISDLQSSFSDNLHPILDRIEQLKEVCLENSFEELATYS